MKRRSLTAALLLMLTAGVAFSQNQTCPRPDCPNQGMCQRKGNGSGNGQCDGNCPRRGNGSCPRNGQEQPTPGSQAGKQDPQRGGMRSGQR
jgi:hypothetical protein